MLSSLFKLSDIVQQEPAKMQASTYQDEHSTANHLFCKSTETLQELFPVLIANSTTHFVCPGQWSMHELLMHLLTLTGPARVYFTTWSLKEYPVRLLIDALEKRNILELHAVLDARVKIRNPEVFHLANQQFTRIKLYDCHAKVVVIENDSWSLAVVGSSNMTNNPRIEAGTLCTVPSVAAFHRSWIEQVMELAHPFE